MVAEQMGPGFDDSFGSVLIRTYSGLRHASRGIQTFMHIGPLFHVKIVFEDHYSLYLWHFSPPNGMLLSN